MVRKSFPVMVAVSLAVARTGYMNGSPSRSFVVSCCDAALLRFNEATKVAILTAVIPVQIAFLPHSHDRVDGEIPTVE